MLRRLVVPSLLFLGCFSEPNTDLGQDETSGTASGTETNGTMSASSSATTASSTSASTTTTTTGDVTSGVTTGTSDGTLDTESADTSTGAACIDVPPFSPEWQGPIIISTMGEMLACPSPFAPGPPMITQAAGTCACECNGPPSAYCDLSWVLDDANCSSKLTQSNLMDCAGVNGNGTAVDWAAAEIGCSPTVAYAGVPGDMPIATCAVNMLMTPCLELPEGFEGPCISRDGNDLQCPQEFPNDVPAVGPTCPGCPPCSTNQFCLELEAYTYAAGGCAGGNTGMLSIDGCTPIPGVVSIEFTAPAPPVCVGVTPGESPIQVCCV